MLSWNKFVAFCIFDAWQVPDQWSSTDAFLLLLSSPPPPWSSPVPPMLLLVGLLLRLPVPPPLPPIPLTLALLTTIPSTVTCNILDYVMFTLAWFSLAWISSNLFLFYTIVCVLHWYPAKDYNCTYDAIYFFIINSILGNATQLTQVIQTTNQRKFTELNYGLELKLNETQFTQHVWAHLRILDIIPHFYTWLVFHCFGWGLHWLLSKVSKPSNIFCTD